ncbi:MAG: hypothetical protein J7578_02835 [Chitinophagaceae bacterium]|nr:hypothetical protein [Chitinophagaceae bacterium]
MKKSRFIVCSFLLLVCGTGITVSASAQDSTARRHNKMPSGQQQYQYRDISTGRDINLRYDRNKKITYNTATNEPVDFYLNTTTGDTVYGRGQYIVNSYMMNNGGTWSLDTTRLRVSDEGVYMIDGNRRLKTEKPYKDHMKSSGRKYEQ